MLISLLFFHVHNIFLKEKFTLPDEAHVLGVVVQQLRDHFNAWRYRLYKFHYKRYKTDEQRRAHCPEDIDQEDWNWLINYWNDPKFKVRKIFIVFFSLLSYIYK